MNNNNNSIDKFLYIWRNKYLNKKIVDYLKYDRNYKVSFKSKKSLVGYSEREYITNLVIDSIFSGDLFNLKQGDLPNNIKSLSILYYDGYYIKNNSIPVSVNELKVKKDLRCVMDNGHLPKCFQFSKNYGLPSSITKLNVGRDLEQFIEWGIPDSVSSLTIGTFSRYAIKAGDIKDSIRELKIGRGNDIVFSLVRGLGSSVFSSSLTTLKVSSYLNIALLQPSDYPPSLTELSINEKHTLVPQYVKPNRLPTSISKLLLNISMKNETIDDIVPGSVKSLTLGYHLKSFIRPYRSIPQSVTSLAFLSPPNSISSSKVCKSCPMYTQPFYKGTIPSSVLCVDFGNRINHELVDIIPFGCIKVILGSSFDFTLFSHSLPSSVKSLSISFNYIKPIHRSIISNLDELIIVNYDDQSTITIKSPHSNIINNQLPITTNKYIKVINSSFNDSILFPSLSKSNYK